MFSTDLLADRLEKSGPMLMREKSSVNKDSPIVSKRYRWVNPALFEGD